ncbi:N4-gp56 family major capsid protein [Roseibium sp.]|uniref:N4-gp56 family major capsid protein n=1 Tax=Roseibium sp. TaxID=1936156 RepID=UPI00327E67C5
MAETRFGVNDALAVKLWARRLEYDIVYRTDISSLIGSSPDSIIHLKTETQKESGDRVRFPLMKKLTGDGFTENEIAEGNGESLSLYSDDILINELGHVVDIPNSGRAIDAQRVPIPLREAARRGLRTWKSERMSKVFFNHVCGYTPETRAKFNGNNTILAPTRQVWVDETGPAVNNGDEDLVAADTFDLRYVDYARELAETGDSPVNPVNVMGKDGGQDISGGKYVMYLHPYQVTDLRTNTDTGQWLDIQKAALSGASTSKNPIYTDALGEYNNVILKKANHVTNGVNSSTGAAIATVRRAVLLGAQSCAVAFGKGNGPTTYAWNEELIDHKRRLEVSIMCMYGMKKTQFDSEDFGVVTVSSYAAAHTG